MPSAAPCAPSTSAAASPRPSAIPPAASTGTSPATSTTSGTSTIVETKPPLPPPSPPIATSTSAPAASDSSAWRRSITCWIQRMPASCARAISSGATPRWNEIAAGPNSSVAAKASSSNGRVVWLIANGRSVSARSRSHSARSSPALRTAVPRLPSPPAWHTAADSSTWFHGPNGAQTIGTLDPEPVADGRPHGVVDATPWRRAAQLRGRSPRASCRTRSAGRAAARRRGC